MADREKVIAALEWCIDKPCNPKCPYFTQEDKIQAYCLFKKIMPDALALLRDQEPQVMTLEEVIKLNDWIWVDYKDGFNGYEYKLDYDSDCDRVEWLDGATDGMEEYGKTWRCWTARPTDEQRKAVPWEGEGIK